MVTPLFTNDEATDPGYRNVRGAKEGPLRFARWHCEYLWILFQQHADKEFRKEVLGDLPKARARCGHHV
jgi:hypothetical protein